MGCRLIELACGLLDLQGGSSELRANVGAKEAPCTRRSESICQMISLNFRLLAIGLGNSPPDSVPEQSAHDPTANPKPHYKRSKTSVMEFNIPLLVATLSLTWRRRKKLQLGFSLP